MQFPLVHHKLDHLQAYPISIQKQNPSFFSSSIYTLCKWFTLVLAFIATVRTITNILIVRFRRNASSLSSIPLLNDDDFSDIDEEEEEDKTTPSSSSEEDLETDDEAEGRNGEYFRFRGSFNGDGGFLRCRSIGDLFSLAEIAHSKSVVKLWDSIGLGLGFGFDNSDSSDIVSVYDDGEEDRRIRHVTTGKSQTPAVSCASPALVVSAAESSSGNLAVRVWDTRVRRRTPAVVAEWGATVGMGVVDDGRYGWTVGDMRNVSSPLENVTLTESFVDTWWPNSFLLKI